MIYYDRINLGDIMSKLILTKKFEKSIDSILEDSTFIENYKCKEEYYNLILEKFNTKNSKYGLSRIDFQEDIFNDLKTYMYSGVIQNQELEDKERHAYVFISPPILESRNILGAQHVFPGLSNIVESYIDHNFYTLGNKPIYFINTSLHNITDYIRGSIISLHVMGVRYIDLIEDRIDLSVYDNISLRSFTTLFKHEIDREKKIIYTDMYEYDYKNKKLKFITKSFKGKTSIGSADRFFVTPSYAAVVLARKEGVDIDVTAIEDYVSIYGKGKNNFEPFIKYSRKMNK